ncbi:MAG: NAD(P)-dependent oxidoreductase [Geminocystis sp.]|nr:NAD(P)-dependent oxidoreductase [Geminocystis sp.]
MEKKLAFLGLGVMGKPMAENLQQAGCSLKAWNRTKNRPHLQNTFLPLVDTIAEAVAEADIIFTCLGDVPDVEEGLLGEAGVIHYARSSSLVVDFSTIGPRAAQAIAQKLATKGIHFLDAPVSGGDIGAKQGTLTIMVGGDKLDFDLCLPYFQILGKNITYCGPTGSGQAVKLCNQVLASLHMVALCEAITLAKIQNIDPQLVVRVCSTGAASSWALTNLGPKILQQDYQPGFMIKHILKDLRLVTEALQDTSYSLPGVQLARQLFETAARLIGQEGYNLGTQAMIRAYLGEDKDNLPG